jgi:integrase
VAVAADLALLTGQRRGDIVDLKWESVTDAGVYFKQSKTGRELLVRMSDTLRAVLDRAEKLLPHIPKVYVIRGEDGRQMDRDTFEYRWQSAMRSAIRDGAITERFHFHDLRAKSVSDSKSVQDAYERAGHSSPSTTRRVYDRGVREVTPLR